MSKTTKTWVDIGRVEDVPMRGARLLKTAHGCIAVFRTAENQVFALDDKCPHKGGPLSQGIVHGTSVTCPLHNWVIGLNDGVAQGADTGMVRTYALKIEGERLLLDLAHATAKSAA
jgi:nitrite reductase (NADH) small subunit